MFRGDLRAMAVVIAVAALPALRVDAKAPSAPSIAVVVAGDAELRDHVRDALADAAALPLQVVLHPLPAKTVIETEDVSEIGQMLAEARRHYVSADFGACARVLERDLDVDALLARDHRPLATRVLFWNIACAVGDGKSRIASDFAMAFATAGMSVPSAIETVSPEVEALIARAERTVAERKQVSVTVTASVEATVQVDGRSGVCKTPCRIDVAPGNHVIGVSADGYVEAWRRVAVRRASSVAFTPSPVSPDGAAKQWFAKYGEGAAIESTPSVRLLARAIRNRRVGLVVAERQNNKIVLRGVIAIDGNVAGRAERSAASDTDLAAAAQGLVRDLLVRGEILEPSPPLYKRTSFWLTVGATAALATAATILFVTDPPRQTSVSF